jgi:hypothetical protein
MLPRSEQGLQYSGVTPLLTRDQLARQESSEAPAPAAYDCSRAESAASPGGAAASIAAATDMLVLDGRAGKCSGTRSRLWRGYWHPPAWVWARAESTQASAHTLRPPDFLVRVARAC